MTLGIAVKYKDGILCASDLAISSGGAKREMVHGKWFYNADYGLVLYAGTLSYVQDVIFSKAQSLRAALRSVYEARRDDDEKDDCDMLRVHEGRITFYESDGTHYECGEYGTVGSGADLADGLLEMVYTTNRSEAWVRGHLDNIFRIVSRKVEGVSRDWKYKVLP